MLTPLHLTKRKALPVARSWASAWQTVTNRPTPRTQYLPVGLIKPAVTAAMPVIVRLRRIFFHGAEMLNPSGNANSARALSRVLSQRHNNLSNQPRWCQEGGARNCRDWTISSIAVGPTRKGLS